MADNIIFDDEFIKDSARRAEESKNNTFDSWLVNLEDKEQPEACSINTPDCENCGS